MAGCRLSFPHEAKQITKENYKIKVDSRVATTSFRGVGTRNVDGVDAGASGRGVSQILWKCYILLNFHVLWNRVYVCNRTL